jgi:type VI secretion system protein ImpA
MAGVELASLTAPVSEADPCGPDLDLEGDPDFLNYMARIEGRLPSSYFSTKDGKPFDRASIDFNAEFEAAKALLERTRDLRLLATIAKLHILNRDLNSFETCIEAVVTLLDTQWEHVHPRGEGGDYAMRVVAIETLDDLPTVVHPLQFVPLANHRRFGVITYRHHMTATGEVKPREDEETPPDLVTIDKGLMEAELPPMIEVMQRFEALQAALGRIRTIWIERAGFEQAVNLDRVSQTVSKILSLVSGIVAKRDPTAAVADAGAAMARDAGAAPIGQIASRADAIAALAAAAAYFSRVEPSNPALLLVRQAQQLIGRSFVDVIRILVPAFVEQANIAIGTQQVFDLPIERLSNLDPSQDELAAAEEGHAQPFPEHYSSGEHPPEEPSSPDIMPEEAQTAEPPAEPAPEETAVPEPGDGGGTDDAGASAGETPRKQRRQAATRQEAFALLDQVAAYFRAAEPTSPIPVFVEHARQVAGRDFMTLLKDFLPEGSLRSTKAEG